MAGWVLRFINTNTQKCLAPAAHEFFWISHLDVETKQQSMQWQRSSSLRPKKFKREHSVKKLMAFVCFFEIKGASCLSNCMIVKLPANSCYKTLINHEEL